MTQSRRNEINNSVYCFFGAKATPTDIHVRFMSMYVLNEGAKYFWA